MYRPSPHPSHAYAQLGALAVALSLFACNRASPPGEESDPPPGGSATEPAVVGSPELPQELARKPEPTAPDAGAAEPPAPYTGPYFAVTTSSAGVYRNPSFDKNSKIGYLRGGGQAPVEAEPIKKDNCKGGWYRLVEGGYVCGNEGTTDLSSPQVRFATRRPSVDDVLPYTYARNAKNGTPLYKSVPTPEQMRSYEPYLETKKKESGESKAKKAPADTDPVTSETVPVKHTPMPFSAEAIRAARDQSGDGESSAAAAPSLAPDAGVAKAPGTPWWQRDDADDKLHEISLEQLAAESDALLAKRMVKGFYVAVDKQFSWNGRPWYKTTKGLVAPADRFWVTKGSEFKGTELDGETLKLPMAWVHGWQKTRPKYTIDKDTKQIKTAGDLKRFGRVALTGKDIEVGGKKYVESTEGFWVREAHLRVTNPGPPPADLGPKERWVDVNLSTQTLVLFEGTRPVYATLVSSGKEHKQKERDHRTPSGEWRIREKHITATMDGDGSAAGDLPYSIEDVPYVMYYYRAYALHGAFWHENYGTQMSHGCVNLAPLDAKHVFFFTEPHLPSGLHGAWATDENPGSRVVVHD